MTTVAAQPPRLHPERVVGSAEKKVLWRIARRSMRENPGRTALVAAMAMMGVLGSVFISTAIVGFRPIGQGIWVPEFLPGLIVGQLPSMLITAAAFSVSTRRREAEYRRIRTIGARDDQILRLVTLEAAGPAALAAAATIATLLGYWLISGPAIRFNEGPASLPISVLFLAGIGVLTAVPTVGAIALAARLPAKSVLASASVATVRIDQSSTHLIDPVPRSRAAETSWPLPTGRRAVGGGLSLGAAGVVVLLAAWWLSNRNEFLFWLPVFGSLFVFAGALVLLNPVVGFVGSLGPRLAGSGRFGQAVRLSLRDVERHRMRSVALIGAGIGVSMLAVMAVAGFMSDFGEDGSAMDTRYILGSEWAATSLGDEIRSTVDVHHEVEFGLIDERINAQVDFDWGIQGYSASPVAIYSPALADALGLPRKVRARAVDGDAVYLRANDARLVAGGASPRDLPLVRYPIGLQGDQSRWGSGLPEVLLPASLAEELGMKASSLQTLWVAAEPVTAKQRAQIRGAGPATQSLQFASERWSDQAVTQISTAIGAGLAVLLGLFAAGLAASESNAEVSALVAAGARPSIRRQILALQTWIYLTVAGVAGSVLGVVLFYAVTRGDSSVPDPIFPWLTIGALIVVVPVATAVLVGLMFRSAKPSISKRAVV